MNRLIYHMSANIKINPTDQSLRSMEKLSKTQVFTSDPQDPTLPSVPQKG